MVGKLKGLCRERYRWGRESAREGRREEVKRKRLGCGLGKKTQDGGVEPPLQVQIWDRKWLEIEEGCLAWLGMTVWWQQTC
jgi:hypothetical protein